MSELKSKKLCEYTGIFLIAIAFLFLYAISTSPLTSHFWGSDSAFFQMVGKNLNQGLIMYKDIFDIKGPYLFLIQYLGYALGIGRYGVFILETTNLCITLFFILKSIELINPKKRVFCLTASLLLFFFFLACTLDCGNLSEEYALPYLFFCLFLFLRYKKQNKIGLAAFGYGIAFTMASLGRVTNSMFICILTLYIMIDMIIEKNWAELFKSAGLFILGFILSFAPFLIYFASVNALPDMLEAVFTFSFSYAVESSFLESIHAMRWPIIIIFIAQTLLALKASRREYKKVMFLMLNVIVMFITLTLGNGYIHYYQTLLPGILTAFWLWWSQEEQTMHFKNYLFLFFGISIFINLVYFVPYSGRVVAAVGMNTQERAQTPFGRFAQKIEQFDSYGRGNYGYESQMYVDDILSKIPEEDRNSVYNYETNAHWLLLSDLKPYNKYCITADHFSCLSKSIADDIETMFKTEKPEYIVTNTDITINNTTVKKHITNDYTCIYQNNTYALYEQNK